MTNIKSTEKKERRMTPAYTVLKDACVRGENQAKGFDLPEGIDKELIERVIHTIEANAPQPKTPQDMGIVLWMTEPGKLSGMIGLYGFSVFLAEFILNMTHTSGSVTFNPIHGKPVKDVTPQDVIDKLKEATKGKFTMWLEEQRQIVQKAFDEYRS